MTKLTRRLFGVAAVGTGIGAKGGALNQIPIPQPVLGGPGFTSDVAEDPHRVPRHIEDASGKLLKRVSLRNYKRMRNSDMWRDAIEYHKYSPNKSWSLAFVHHLVRQERIAMARQDMSIIERIRSLLSPYRQDPYVMNREETEAMLFDDSEDE